MENQIESTFEQLVRARDFDWTDNVERSDYHPMNCLKANMLLSVTIFIVSETHLII